MDIKFAIPAKYQKLFFQFNPSETRGGINEKTDSICTDSNQEKLILIPAQTQRKLWCRIRVK